MASVTPVPSLDITDDYTPPPLTNRVHITGAHAHTSRSENVAWWRALPILRHTPGPAALACSAPGSCLSEDLLGAIGQSCFLGLMLILTCASKLASLRKLLTHNFPESLKACGALHHVINGNPFKLEVLVDQWPDFSTVICRPPLEDMKDPSDHYMNTYFLFSKDLQNLSQMLEDPQVVNWNQDLQIQGCQPALGGVLQQVSSKHGRQIQTTSSFLYMRDRMTEEELKKINSISSKELYYTPLLVHEAPLVNHQWEFGMNKYSLHFIELCIQNLPTICVRKKGLDQPIAWGLTNNSEIRMAYTIPAYRNQGLARNILLKLAVANHELGAPIFTRTAADNFQSQAMILKAGFQLTGSSKQYYFKQKS